MKYITLLTALMSFVSFGQVTIDDVKPSTVSTNAGRAENVGENFDRLKAFVDPLEVNQLTQAGAKGKRTASDLLAAAVTAASPGGQGDGAQIAETVNVSTVGTDNDGITLFGFYAGSKQTVYNNGANILEVWPASGDNLGEGINTATTVNPGQVLVAKGLDTTNANTVVSVAAVGQYTTWNFSAGAGVPTVTAGAAPAVKEYGTNDVNLDTFAFAGDATEEIQVAWPVPDNWDLGTVKIKLFWDADTSASAADVVSFDVAAQALGNDDAIDAAFGSVVEIDDVVIAVGDMHVTPASAAITVGGTPVLGDMIIFSIKRDHDDAADDMVEDLLLLGGAIQYKELTTIPAIW